MINREEKLNRLNKDYPGILEVLWFLSGNISRLNREFIYNSLGNRTSLEQFAEIEHLEVDDLIDYLHISTGNLQELGTENKIHRTDIPEIGKNKIPQFLQALQEVDIIEIDVRKDILSGQDPINRIKTAIGQLNDENAVRLINIFEPVPLYFVLGRKGIKHWSEYKDNNWYIYFYK
ncbi:MAG: DUF2249 domain-containing protein [Bacillota bacterium]